MIVAGIGEHDEPPPGSAGVLDSLALTRGRHETAGRQARMRRRAISPSIWRSAST